MLCCRKIAHLVVHTIFLTRFWEESNKVPYVTFADCASCLVHCTHVHQPELDMKLDLSFAEATHQVHWGDRKERGE